MRWVLYPSDTQIELCQLTEFQSLVQDILVGPFVPSLAQRLLTNTSGPTCGPHITDKCPFHVKANHVFTIDSMELVEQWNISDLIKTDNEMIMH